MAVLKVLVWGVGSVVLGYAWVQATTDSANTKVPGYAYVVDGFEVPGEWEVRYSKFRSKVMDPKNETKDSQREPDSSMYDWIVAGKTSIPESDLLSPLVYYENIFGKYKQESLNHKTILGFQVRWDFPTYNYVDVLPKLLDSEPSPNRYSKNRRGRYPDQMMTLDSFDEDHYVHYKGEPYILLPGRLRRVSLHVLSSYYPGYVEFHLEDKLGNVYNLYAGELNYLGWKKMSADLPSYVSSNPFYVSRAWPLKLKRIRIVMNPEKYGRLAQWREEKVFYLYFDALHVHADLSIYDYAGNHKSFGDRVWREGRSTKTPK